MDFISRERACIAQTYKRQPVCITQGSGCYVYDEQGKRYLDMVAGIAVNNVGHCCPAVVRSLREQAKKLMHVSNLYYTMPQIEYAEMLTKNSGFDKAFFCNSGAEANEAAIKLARKHTGRSDVISMQNSFHGRTLATLAATGQQKYRAGFEPMPAGFFQVPYNDAAAVADALSGKTAAVLVEPVQAEGGVIVPSPDYLRQLRAICDERGVLLIFDEVQTGFGRLGALFGWQRFGVKPDIITLAKGIAGGFPMAAMLAAERVAAAFTPGSHASTFGGNPLACAAAKASLQFIVEKGLPGNAERIGAHIAKRLKRLNSPLVKDVRGLGLMIGVEFETKEKAEQVRDAMREKGVLVAIAGERVIRLVPPLVMRKKQAEEFLSAFAQVLAEHAGL
jgi:acetylornithine/N-succinyldiaminopimelate aminotransferase